MLDGYLIFIIRQTGVQTHDGTETLRAEQP